MIVKKAVTVIQVLLILVFIGCAVYVGKYFYDLHVAGSEFEALRREVRSQETVDASGNYEEKYAENGMLLSYYDIYNKNNDLCGWLRIKDTVIDYPVVQAKDNEYYLHRNFDKSYSYSGIPFLDCECKPTASGLIIYAHNMKDGSMFSAVSKYENEDFYKNHRKINYDTLYERGEYEIISVFRTTVGSKNEFKYYQYADIETERDFEEYVSAVKRLSVHDTGISANWGDKLLTLSTCAYHTSNERLVVVAVKKSE